MADRPDLWDKDADPEIIGKHGVHYTRAISLLTERAVHAKSEVATVIALHERYIGKLESLIKLQDHAVDRWVPCADHRDKINHGYEKWYCYVCLNETLERKLAKALANIDAMETESARDG